MHHVLLLQKEAIAAEWLEHRSNVMKLLRDREANFSENTSSTVATSHVNLDLDSLFSQQSRKDCLESLLTVTGEDGTVRPGNYLMLASSSSIDIIRLWYTGTPSSPQRNRDAATPRCVG